MQENLSRRSFATAVLEILIPKQRKFVMIKQDKNTENKIKIKKEVFSDFYIA